MIERFIVNVLQRPCDSDARIGNEAGKKLIAEFSFNFRRRSLDGFSIECVEEHAFELFGEVVFESLFVGRFTDAAENEVAPGN